MKLLGKDLYEWDFIYIPECCSNLKYTFSNHNLNCSRHRLADGETSSAAHCFIKEGNEYMTTRKILTGVRYVYELKFFTNEEWDMMIPYIENALQFNIDYVELLNNISPFVEDFCQKYPTANYTLQQRFHLEFWQGKFNEGHWCNPEKKPNYK